jgi:hypothetical protein
MTIISPITVLSHHTAQMCREIVTIFNHSIDDLEFEAVMRMFSRNFVYIQQAGALLDAPF